MKAPLNLTYFALHLLTIFTYRAMASEDELGRRKKRAWRKPREPITPEPVGASLGCSAKPVKLQRTGRHEATPHRPPAVPDFTPVAQEPVGKVGKGRDPEAGEATEHILGARSSVGTADSASGGVAMGVSKIPGKPGLPLEIDGSVMEGVNVHGR